MTGAIAPLRRFAGHRKCLRSFIARHWAKQSRAGIDLDATGGRMSNERKAISDRTFAAQAACWVLHHPADEASGRGGLTTAHLRILAVMYGPHPYSTERATESLCNEFDLTLKRLGREQDHAESVMRARYKAAGLLLEGE